MSKLTTADRKALPAESFGEPGKRAYPMPDKSHAANAKARASQAVNARRISPATEATIDAKANRILGTTHNPANRLPDHAMHKGRGLKG